MATHSSNLAWRIPWREKPGGPQSMSPQSQTGLSAHIPIAMRDFDIELGQMGKNVD